MNEVTFKDLGLSEVILAGLEKKGFVTPTPIQAKSIPLLLTTDHELIGLAQTGTGKTAAFGLPILQLLDTAQKGKVQALMLAPTRELAIQIADELSSFKAGHHIHITAVYGGQAYGPQIKALRTADIVVGTPGRILDHINQKTLMLDQLKFLVLDEADEMLNMGFKEDIEAILKTSPGTKRTFLFSATMPNQIFDIAKKYMKHSETVQIKKSETAAPLTTQQYYLVHRDDKFETLTRVIDTTDEFYGIVFCRTKLEVDAIAQQLIQRGYSSDGLHGDISQAQRIKILDKFKSRRLRILVATDVASRGIDVQDLSHVINYALPQDPESYIHRVGRTGRAGKTGTAISLISPSEHSKLMFIQKIAKQTIEHKTVPDITELVRVIQDRFKQNVDLLVSEYNPTASYTQLAAELLEKYPAEQLVTALVQRVLGNALDASRYRQISAAGSRSPRPFDNRKSFGAHTSSYGTRPRFESQGSRGRGVYDKDRVRLFVAKGKNDGYTVQRLLRFLEDESRVPGRAIHDVQILDRFSFISVSDSDSETLMRSFRDSGENRKPLITRARDKT